MQWRPTGVVFGVHVRFVCEECLDYLRTAKHCRGMQRRLAIFTLGMDIRAVRQQ